MKTSEYQKLAARTLIDRPGFNITDDEWRMIWGALRLCAIAGSIAEQIKKGVFHQHGVSMANLRSDLIHSQEVAISMYQEKGYAGLPINDVETMQIWNLIGLAGEVGEVVKIFGEAYYSGHAEIKPATLTDEMGDVLWYLSALATKSDIFLNDVMERNIDKLRGRYPDGYSAEASRNRKESA